MSEKVPVLICTSELDNGYIFKNFFSFNFIRARPIMTITQDKIISNNCTADEQLYGWSYLHGDEINLIWNTEIPKKEQKLSLTFEANSMFTHVGRIKKKDQARINILQLRYIKDVNNFSGTKSSDEFIINISYGTGGEGREGLRSLPATRTNYKPFLVNNPQPDLCHKLVVPIKYFRQMIDSFNKCKKENIKFIYNVEGKGAIMIITENSPVGNTGAIVEKYGDIDDNIYNDDINDDCVVKSDNKTVQVVIEPKLSKPNEYTFNANKVPIFWKLASMHNEGSVKVEYQEGKHLNICFRFGSFGEVGINLANR